jgi:hypothetical protein
VPAGYKPFLSVPFFELCLHACQPVERVPGLIGVIDPAQQYEDPASEPFFDHIHRLVIAVTSVLACIPSRCSRGQVLKRILLFGLILERCLREILAHSILDDIRLGDREADRRIV